MAPIEVSIHKYFSEPQNYNPGFSDGDVLRSRFAPSLERRAQWLRPARPGGCNWVRSGLPILQDCHGGDSLLQL